jgi:hypothetical protein
VGSSPSAPTIRKGPATSVAGPFLFGRARFSLARGFFGLDETKDVNEVRVKMEDERGEYYDLQGRRVAQPTKGLYIVNGKKVFIK